MPCFDWTETPEDDEEQRRTDLQDVSHVARSVVEAVTFYRQQTDGVAASALTADAAPTYRSDIVSGAQKQGESLETGGDSSVFTEAGASTERLKET